MSSIVQIVNSCDCNLLDSDFHVFWNVCALSVHRLTVSATAGTFAVSKRPFTVSFLKINATHQRKQTRIG